MANTMIGGIVAAFIGIVIGIALLSTTADSASEITNTVSVVDRPIALTNLTPVAVVASGDNLIAVTNVTTGGVVLNATTHYTVVNGTDGTVNLTGVTYGTGTYNVSFNYQDANYVANSTARSLTGIIIILFAMAIFLGAAGMIDWKAFGV